MKSATACTNSKRNVIQGNVPSVAISTNSFKHNLFKTKHIYTQCLALGPCLRDGIEEKGSIMSELIEAISERVFDDLKMPKVDKIS